MTTQNESPAAVETRYLGEGIALLRSELRELRDEVRSANASRPTHAEIVSLNNLWHEKHANLLTRADNRADSLEKKIEKLEAKLEELEEESEQSLKTFKNELKEEKTERQKYVKQFWFAVIGGVAALLVTNGFQFFRFLAQGVTP